MDHFQVEISNLQISYTRCVGRLGVRGGGLDLVVSIVGTVTPSCYKWIFSSLFMYTFYAKSML